VPLGQIETSWPDRAEAVGLKASYCAPAAL